MTWLTVAPPRLKTQILHKSNRDHFCCNLIYHYNHKTSLFWTLNTLSCWSATSLPFIYCTLSSEKLLLTLTARAMRNLKWHLHHFSPVISFAFHFRECERQRFVRSCCLFVIRTFHWVNVQTHLKILRHSVKACRLEKAKDESMIWGESVVDLVWNMKIRAIIM